MIDVTKEDLFPTSIFHTKINEDILLDIKKIVEREKQNWKKGLHNIKAKTSGWEGLKYPPVREIANLCCETILPSISKESGWGCDMWSCQEAWINVYEKGDYADYHTHFGTDYCCVLIIQSGESNLKFHDPKEVTSMYKFFEIKEEKILNEEEGILLFFPSWLGHSVTKCKKERITAAFNFKANLSTLTKE